MHAWNALGWLPISSHISIHRFLLLTDQKREARCTRISRSLRPFLHTYELLSWCGQPILVALKQKDHSLYVRTLRSHHRSQQRQITGSKPHCSFGSRCCPASGLHGSLLGCRAHRPGRCRHAAGISVLSPCRKERGPVSGTSNVTYAAMSIKYSLALQAKIVRQQPQHANSGWRRVIQRL